MNTTTKTFGVTFFVKQHASKDDELPIYVRITVDGKRADISLKKRVNKNNWDKKRNNLKGNNSSESKQLIYYFDQVKSKLFGFYQELQLQGKTITAEIIKDKFLGRETARNTLCELINYHNQQMENILSYGTMKNYYTTERYVKKFLRVQKKRNDIHLSELSYKFLLEFDAYLRKHPLKDYDPLTNNGLMKHIERLKKIANLGVQMGWLEKSPFQTYKLKFVKKERTFLSEQELQSIENICLKDFQLILVRDLFVFSCYTGLAYSDLMSLSPSKISKGIDGRLWINTYRQKTNIPVHLPLLAKAKNIFEKYQTHPMSISKGCSFPYISNQAMNREVKIIAELCGIPKRLTFHLARHTFATTITLSNGVPIETVSKMLGHTKISTTQIYAKVVERKISNDMLLLEYKLQG